LKFEFDVYYYWRAILLAGNSNFKFRIVVWNIFFRDLKNTSHFLKKSHLEEILLFHFSDGDIISVISFILLGNYFI